MILIFSFSQYTGAGMVGGINGAFGPPLEEASAIPPLSPEERTALESLDAKLEAVSDLVRGVASGFQTGALIYGEAGIGKSFAVIGTLEKMNVEWLITNSHISPRGLFQILRQHPDAVHVFEDVESIHRKPELLELLLAATGSQSTVRNPPRRITWQSARGQEVTFFTGGLVLTSNRGLAGNSAAALALGTRMPPIELSVTRPEMLARIHEICQQGFSMGSEHTLRPDDCWEVAQHAIACLAESQARLNIRTIVKAFQCRLQCQAGHSETGWRDLVRNDVMGRTLPSSMSRRPSASEQTQIALELDACSISGDERLERWRQRTSMSPASYYRALSARN